jgi:nucleoside-diphosphate-sugar epimerase
MIPKRLIDITKAREELGFLPRIDLEIGLKNLVSWYRKNKL